jgi:glycolate oxidase iron-sulfur subunit
MRTKLDPKYLNTTLGKQADEILRTCVHCGFCNATCPTYQLTGDERDGPRGRIYLIKNALEGGEVSESTRLHLDRCLVCRACETTCPSGVRYAELLEAGRSVVEHHSPVSAGESATRWMMRKIFSDPARGRALFRSAQMIAPLIPGSLRDKLPESQRAKTGATARAQPRRMLTLAGCVQAATTPSINLAAKAICAQLGIELVEHTGAGCCGAISQHLNALPEARDFMRKNLRAWASQLDRIEQFVVTASGCGATLLDYGRLLENDPNLADSAARVTALTRDLSSVVNGEDLTQFAAVGAGRRVAVHTPCTMRHGMQAHGNMEAVLSRCGFTVVPYAETHACCGAAGTYTLRHPLIADKLRDIKIADMSSGNPELIVSANIGCLLHLKNSSPVPVMHWAELLASSARLLD